MTTVLIVDDLNSIREFLKINLSSEPDIEIVGLVDNGLEAIAQVKKHQPDIVLMDINMPGKIDGIVATEEITKLFPHAKVLLLTSQDDSLQLNRALQAGSRGYILKNTSIKDIANIIRLAEKGFFQIGPILGNWNGSLHNSIQLNGNRWKINQKSNKLEAVVPDRVNDANSSQAISHNNQTLASLTSELFQLQETIKYQEDTIANLANQYSEVKHEIKSKQRKERHFANASGFNSYSFRSSKSRTQKQQNFLFIVSFFLGVITVFFLMFMMAIVSK